MDAGNQDNSAEEVQAMLQDVDQQILTQGYQRAIVYACGVLAAGGFGTIHFPNDLAYKLAALTLGAIALGVHWLRSHTALKGIADLAHDAGKAAVINAATPAPAQAAPMTVVPPATITSTKANSP